MRKFFSGHQRLWIAVLAASAAFFVLPGQWSVLSRVLVCWNGGVDLFLVLIFHWMTRLTAAQICSRYIEEDASASIILAIVTLAAMLSLGAIVEPLATIKQVTGAVRAAHFALAALTLINSWVMVPTMFATHYADLYYSVKDDERPLHFPNSPMPVFWDFIYFSFTIAAACQTADVATLNAKIRTTVVVHTLVSFLFNASILGFAINVTAGLIGAS
ncbi:MAG: DUF1345 domain-containing protein [Steroidobacteraceae bacterium]